MPQVSTDEQVRRRGIAALERELGPVEALRFLALIRREPFDYQAWREQRFAGMSLAEVLEQSRKTAASSISG